MASCSCCWCCSLLAAGAPLPLTTHHTLLHTTHHALRTWGGNVFIKLAFAYEATTQCSRTDRKPRSAHVTVLSALDSALAATAPPAPPPPPPLPGKKIFIKLAFAYEATTQCSRTDRKPRYLLDRCAASSVFRFRLLLFLSCFPYTRSYTCSTMPNELSNGCRVKG